MIKSVSQIDFNHASEWSMIFNLVKEAQYTLYLFDD
jgi:hypothetical protein